MTRCPFNGGQFSVIEPQQVTRGARVNDDIPGTVVRMHFHATAATRAAEQSFVLGRIDWNGSLLSAAVLTSSTSHDLSEVLIRD